MKTEPTVPVVRGRTPRLREINPFLSLQQEVDRLFDGFAGLAGFGRDAALVPSMDVAETDGEITLKIELAGLKEKDVEIKLSDDVLSIRGEKHAEKEEKGKNYRLVERSSGTFERAVALPAGVDAEKIKATMADGLLTVVIPKAPAAKAKTKTIDIKAAA